MSIETSTTTEPRILLSAFLILGLLVTPVPATAANADEAAPGTGTNEAVPGTAASEAEPGTEEDEGPEVDIEPYGLFKLDLSEDTALVDPGNFARWVVSESIFERHSHFNMTARQSRLGARVRVLDDGDMTLLGRVEIDFYGGGAENKNSLMLRHAYLEVGWPESGWSLLAGQASDLISPLYPSTVNYTVAWWVGNIGYRRPQVRVTRTARLGDAVTFTLAGAVSRTIGDDFGAVEPGDSGADSGLPTFQGRIAVGWTGDGGRSATVGVSAHRGRENLHEAPEDPDLEFDSWSVNLDVSLSVTPEVAVKGELWTGENLDDYLGGVGQGINVVDGLDIAATGGWLAVELAPADRWRLGVGAGIDDPDDSTLTPNGRSRNRAVWANVFRDLGEHLTVAAELSHWRTTWLDLEPGCSFRGQGAVILSF